MSPYEVLVILWVLIGISFGLDLSKSGGHPKFPNAHQSCGTRNVDWTPRLSKIIGGDIPPLGAIPWIVDLLHKGRHHCGGVLISSRLILTVAHCYLDNLSARVGTYDSSNLHRNPYQQTIKIEKALLHPDFRTRGPHSNDIALLLVHKPGFSRNRFVKPSCVPEDTPPAGARCEVSGWGVHDPRALKEVSAALRTAVVPLLAADVCRERNVLGDRRRGGQEVLDTMACAGKLGGGVDACGGDSGGPLMCLDDDGRFVLTGLVSWGVGCAKKRRPGVYTRVAAYKDWIVRSAEELGVEVV